MPWLPIEIIVPLISALISPLILLVIGRWLNRRKESADIGAALREELRDDNRDLRDRNKELEDEARKHAETIQAAEEWKRRFFKVKKEKQYLEFELILVQREIEHIRRQHEEYTAIRERAERQFEDGESSE